MSDSSAEKSERYREIMAGLVARASERLEENLAERLCKESLPSVSDSCVEPAVLSEGWIAEQCDICSATDHDCRGHAGVREVAAAVLEYVADELERGAESWLKIACVPGRRTSAHDSRINELRAVAVTFRAKAREVRGEV